MAHVHLTPLAQHSFKALQDKLAEHDDALNTLEAGVPTNVFNVKQASPPAVGNGVTDDTTAIRAAITAAAVSGGVVYFPNGTYLLSEHGTSLQCLSVPANVSLQGQSKAGVTLFLKANQRASVRMIYCTSGATNLTISDMTLDGNVANQTDQTGLQHNDAIFLDNTTHVRIKNVEIARAAASAIVLYQNSSDVQVDHVYVHDCGWMGIALGDPSGQLNCAVRDSRFKGCRGGVHIESNGVVEPTDNFLVERCYMDATSGNAALEIVGGNTPAEWASNIVALDCQIVGFVLVSNATNVYIGAGTNIVNSDAAGTPKGAVRVIAEGSNITVEDCFITQTSSGTATYAVEVAGNASGDTLSNVNILNNWINVQSTAADGVLVQSCINARVEGNQIFGNASMGSTFYGVHVYSKLARAMDWVIVRGNYINDFVTGLYVEGGGTSASFNINDLIVMDNLFESSSSIMTGCMSLDGDGRHNVKQATVSRNDSIGGLTMFATYPNVPMLISGNRGAGGVYSCAASPQSVVTEIPGATATNRAGGAGTTWFVKESGSGTNTGWVGK